MVTITRNKLGDLAENAEKMLRYGGKLMQCIDELQQENGMQGGEMGERTYMQDYNNGSYGNGGYYPNGGYNGGVRYGMGERQGVPGTGPYSRYR